MSELNAVNSDRIYWAVDQVEREPDDIGLLHLDDNLFYIKSEVDSYIYDLKKQHIKDLQALEKYWIDNCEAHEKEAVSYVTKCYKKKINHNKYKRCVAMAKLCHAMWWTLRYDGVIGQSVFYWRWWNLWSELAEKFKEEE